MALIFTYYMGPTDRRGARIRAKSMHNPAQMVTLHWDYEHGADVNHRAAAQALASKMDWAGDWFACGSLANGTMSWARPSGAAFTLEPAARD